MSAISTSTTDSRSAEEMLGRRAASDWNPKLTNDDQIEFHRRKQPNNGGRERQREQGCQMTKFDPFPSLDCARVEGVGERKGSNFAA